MRLMRLVEGKNEDHPEMEEEVEVYRRVTARKTTFSISKMFFIWKSVFDSNY